MRGIRTTGFGLAVALSANTGLAQEPPRPAAQFGAVRPAAQFGAVRPAGEPAPGVLPAGLVARGQTGSTALPMPQAVGGPNVTEIRGSAAPPTGAPTTVGQPVVVSVGQPIPIGQPIPAGQPVPFGQPFPAGTTFPTGVGGPFVPPPVIPGSPSVPVGVGAPVMAPSVLPGAGYGLPGPALDTPLMAGGYGYGPMGLLGGPLVAGRLTASADYLLWFVKSYAVPPLVTTSSPAFNGILGRGDTQTVIGGSSFANTLYSGGRFGLSYALGPKWAVDGNVFFLGTNGKDAVVSSAQYPVLARPFYNLNSNQPFSELIAFPGMTTGAAVVNTETSLMGAGVDFRRKLLCGGCNTFDLLTGFRALRLSEGLTVTEAFNRSPANPLVVGMPNLLSGSVTDQFQTTNEFYGWNFGAQAEMRRGRWFVNGKASIAIGEVFQTVNINGAQQLMYDTGPAVAAGGLLALPGGNIGRFTQNKFAVVPEVGVQVGYYLTPHLRLGVGYNFIYLSSVVRPGDQIDQGLDVTRIPNFGLTPLPAALPYARPAPTMKTSDVFLQGISFSLQWVF